MAYEIPLALPNDSVENVAVEPVSSSRVSRIKNMLRNVYSLFAHECLCTTCKVDCAERRLLGKHYV